MRAEDVAVGVRCRPTAEAWDRYLEKNPRTETHDMFPQPIVTVHPREDLVQLAFPMWWWKFEDLEHVEAGR